MAVKPEAELEDDFLGEDYTPPANDLRYMKFKDGDNEFRILSNPIIGWEYWIKNATEKKPVRLTYTEENGKIATAEAKKNSDPKDQKAKHFWAMKVWNYDTKRIEILTINQKTIQATIIALSRNKRWGNPAKKYDISVFKTGADKDTEYEVQALPMTPLAEEVEIALNSELIRVEALFYDADPFDETWVNPSEFQA